MKKLYLLPVLILFLSLYGCSKDDEIICQKRVMTYNVHNCLGTDEVFDYKRIADRLAKLTNGVALIKVGATTEVELKEKKLRIEDALSATKAAVEEGIVAGGGTALVNIMPAVEKCLNDLSVLSQLSICLELLTAILKIIQLSVDNSDLL